MTLPLRLGGVVRGETLEFEQGRAVWQLDGDLRDVNNARAEVGEEMIELPFKSITLLLQLLRALGQSLVRSDWSPPEPFPPSVPDLESQQRQGRSA